MSLKESSNTFKKDLKYGEEIEYYVLDVIQKKYPLAYKVEGYFKDYDIYIPEIQKGIEVKGDYMSCHTGNIVVETDFNNKPSALTTTKAFQWVFVDGYNLMFISPFKLKQHIAYNKYNKVNFIGNGDTKEKTAFLIKKDKLQKSCSIVKIDKDSIIYGDFKK